MNLRRAIAWCFTWCLALLGSGFLAAAVWAGPVANPPSTTATDSGLSATSASGSESDDADQAELGAHAETQPKAARTKSSDTTDRVNVAQGAPRDAAPAASSAAPNGSERDWVRNTYKDLADASGALEAVQYLNNGLKQDKAAALADASDDNDASSAARRAEAQANTERRQAAAAPARTEEQRKLDAVQASFLFSALMADVLPWAIGLAALYALIYGIRLLLAYSRMQAERKRKRRQASAGRSRRARLE